jgi:tRNA(fMet)-specific endonuclease VapC
MDLILDTNALSAYADGVPSAVARIDQATSIAVPVIVLGEYYYGVSHSRHRARYEQWLERFIGYSKVLDVTVETARQYAGIRSALRRAGTPVPSNDVWIAALAKQHGLPVISRDSHFDHVTGLERVSW